MNLLLVFYYRVQSWGSPPSSYFVVHKLVESRTVHLYWLQVYTDMYEVMVHAADLVFLIN